MKCRNNITYEAQKTVGYLQMNAKEMYVLALAIDVPAKADFKLVFLNCCIVS